MGGAKDIMARGEREEVIVHLEYCRAVRKALRDKVHHEALSEVINYLEARLAAVARQSVRGQRVAGRSATRA